MQFFTPQLYLQCNSRDAAVAERANEEWETAIRAYKEQLGSIRERMPAQVVALSELCLHDAEVLKRESIYPSTGPIFFHDFPFPAPVPLWSAVEVISVLLDGEILSLVYNLWNQVRTREAPDTWTFSKAREDWLYDEISGEGEPRRMLYTHSILLSTGIVLEIPFLAVFIHRFPLPQVARGPEKKIA
jgi:hypothetical protein